MSQLASQGAREIAIAQHAADPFIVLLTIAHATLAEPLRLASNFEAIVSRGETYLAFPLRVELPTDSDQSPEARLTVSNVSRRVGRVLEGMVTPAECTLELVLASAPDIVERAWGGLSFTSASWDAMSAQVALSHIAYWDEPWPRKRVTPRGFPGLFE